MKLMKALVLLLAAIALPAMAQLPHDFGAGGGVNLNMTAGTVNCNLSGTSGCTIVPNTLFGITGTTTNDSANAGAIGELQQATVASGSAVALTTATAANITSLSLPAGDWEVTGACDITLTGATTTIFVCGISTTTATQPTQPGGSGLGTEPLVTQANVLTTTTGRHDVRVGPIRVSFATATTIFLVATNTFSAGSEAGFGSIKARRVR